jgi:tetratricopeptide (TPR) repeat protein
MAPRISLCMIAKNEAEMLPACLAAARGAFDELVLVDTGSTDKTVDIARAHGAVIGHFDWVDDFSAARNAALDLATGDWVLSLDADERLAASAPARLRAAVLDDQFDAGLLPYHSPSTLGASPVDVISGAAAISPASLVARLARRSPSLRWQARVHEGWHGWLGQAGRRVRVLHGVDLIHWGAAPEWRDPRGKSDRNLKLLQLEAAENPSDLHSRAYLCLELFNRGRQEDARVSAEESWSIVQRQHAESGRLAQPGAAVPAMTVFGWIAVLEGRYDEVLRAVAILRGGGSGHPNLSWLEAVVFENRALRLQGEAQVAALRHAADAFTRTLALEGRLFAQVVLDDAVGAPIRVRLGTVLLQLGDLERADRLFQEALKREPANTLAALGRVEVTLHRGDAAAALRLVEPLLAGETADAWLLAADAARRGGDHGTARHLLTLANQRVREQLVGLHRLPLLNRLNEELGG